MSGNTLSAPLASAHRGARLAPAALLRNAGSRLLPWLLPLALLALWQLGASQGWISPQVLPSPHFVWLTLQDLYSSGDLWLNVQASMQRVLVGFAAGSVLGLVPLFNRIVGPSFNTFKQISLFAWIPLISVWFGLGDVAKVTFLSLAALVPVVVNTCDGIRSTPTALLEVARVFGYSRWQTLLHVVLPAAAPSIFTGVYLALIYSWLATIGAEYLLVAGHGIGNTLIEGSEHFQMDLVIFGMFVIGLVGWSMNALARALERRLARHRYGAA